MSEEYTAKPRPFANEDRNEPYRSWRYKLGEHLYVCDIDQVEIELVGGIAEPRGLIELTLCTTILEAPGLLEGIWARLDPNGTGSSRLQTQVMCAFANALDIPALLVVHQQHGNRFAVRRLDVDPSTWKIRDEASYIEGLKWLRARKG